MPLHEYLKRYNKSISGFAKESQITRQSLHNYLRGTTLPTSATARRIVKASNYLVTFEDLYEYADYKEEVDDVL